MAFVYKDERFHDNNLGTEKVGPGSYLGPKQYKPKESQVPFNSSAPRVQQQQQKHFCTQKPQTPGPGTYNMPEQMLNDKVLVSTQNQEVKIIEIPKENSVFKSGTARLYENKRAVQTPGPGTYSTQIDFKQNEIKKQRDNKQILEENKYKKNVLIQIKKNNNYQAIPSIPGTAQIFGYSENPNSYLQVNENPQQIHSGVKYDTIGPGQYQLKSGFEENKTQATWSKSGVARMKQKVTKSDMIIGPGTYEQNCNLNPLYKYKPSSGFSSKSVRLFDIRKGAISNKYTMKQYENQMRKLAGDETCKLFFHDDDEVEYIEDAVPGPGTYYNAAQGSSIKIKSQPEKLQFFGSSSTRFKTLEIAGKTIGPGNYELRSKDFLPKKVTTKAKVAFSAKNPRFNEGTVSTTHAENPGPGTYDPKITFEDTMVRKFQTGQKGQFGINDKRFKLSDDNEVPGPGSYFEADAGRINDQKYFEKGVKQNYYFMQAKHPARDSFLQNIQGIPPVGNYELDYYNLKIDPDLIVQVDGLGFNSSQPRFKEIIKKNENENEDDEDDESSVIHQQSLNQMLQQPKKIDGLGFLTKDERFSYKPKTVPGPGHYYDSHKNLWNKRTYNIEFTGIQ